MLSKATAAALLFAASLPGQSTSKAELVPDPWKPLRFLIGGWDARTQGGSAQAASSGTYTFQLELRNHVLARHSLAAGCKGPADFDCEHGDLLFIYPNGASATYKAIYFDNEGHVIHYDVTAPSATTAVFNSDPSQPGPRFRLVYELKGSTMYGKFQMQMPGQAEFKSYLEWSGEKK